MFSHVFANVVLKAFVPATYKNIAVFRVCMQSSHPPIYSSIDRLINPYKRVNCQLLFCYFHDFQFVDKSVKYIYSYKLNKHLVKHGVAGYTLFRLFLLKDTDDPHSLHDDLNEN